MSEDAFIVITSAIKTAFIDYPGSGHGTTWDQVAKSDEESIHLARLGWLLFAKPDIPLPGSRTRMPRSPKARSSCRRDRGYHLAVPRLLARAFNVAGKATLAAEHQLSSRQDGPTALRRSANRRHFASGL